MAKEKSAKVRVDLDTFIKAWEGSANVAEVSAKTGIKPMSIMARASKLRGAPYNIPLKNMQRGGGAKINVADAKALIATLRNTTVETVDEASAKLVAKREAKPAKK